jgi:hypothetical protein
MLFMAEPTPTLTLTTLVTGQPVRIDGRLYQIRHLDSLSLRQGLELETLTPRLGALMRKAKSLTTHEDAELEQKLDTFCRLVLDAPDPVQRKLRTLQRLQICRAFLALRPTDRGRTGAKAKPTTHRPIGAKSSRGSRASTAGVSSTGSSASPSVS